MLGGNDYWFAGFDDSTLLIGDFCKHAAQNRHMVIRNGCNHRDNRVHHVGGIQSAAKPHFQDRHINLSLAKVQKSQSGGELEGGGVFDDIGQRAQFIRQFHEILLADPLAIDDDAFLEFHEVRRSVQANFVAGSL